jgi:hypothetical protein
MEFNIGDRVNLPFQETGTVVGINNILWGFKYRVKIRKATLNKTNEIHDFKEEQLIHQVKHNTKAKQNND